MVNDVIKEVRHNRVPTMQTSRLERLSSRAGISLSSIVLIIYFISIAYPLFWMVMSSFKSTTEIYAHSWAPPKTWLVQNFAAAFADISFPFSRKNPFPHSHYSGSHVFAASESGAPL